MERLLLCLFVGIALLIAGVAFWIGAQSESKDVQEVTVKVAATSFLTGGALSVALGFFHYFRKKCY